MNADDLRLQRQLGKAYEDIDPAKSLRHLRRATQLSPDSRLYWSDLGSACESMGDAAAKRITTPPIEFGEAEERGFQFPVLLQDRNWKVSKENGTLATPVAFLIGEDGVIARDAAVWRDAILALIRDRRGSQKEE